MMGEQLSDRDQAQGVTSQGYQLKELGGITSGWRSVTSVILQGSIEGTVLFNVFISDLDAGLEGVLNKFADGNKLGGAVDSHKDGDVLQRELDKLEVCTIIV